ncbi:MAG TPA: Ig-like domain-containing protein, partial [Geobacteraceae bacterium]|nr:Ig-like domain-containing protein [Geobacteraceae bacterium]
MKRLHGLMITVLFVIVTAGGAGATDLSANLLTGFDYSIVGLDLVSEPAYQAVPKGISSRVNTGFSAGEFDVADIIAQLPRDYTVRAELSGPAFQTPLQLVTLPGKPFDLPSLPVVGRYSLSNIRLCDAGGTAIMGAVPQAVAVESIPDPLITQVTTRQLSVQELQERGVTFDKSNFTVYEFTAGIATASGQIPITLPVIIPTSQTVLQTPDLQGAAPISLPQSQVYAIPPDVPETAVPPNLEVHPIMMEVQEKDKVDKLVIPPIPGVVVIPGNIGFLHQYFSALALVTNGAPLQSGLSIRDVRASVSFPAGEDLVPGSDAIPGDDPLRMAKGASDYFPRIMPVTNAAADGKAGTSDDVGVLQPGESGQADFTIEGMKEGTHKVDFDITATLDGLPIGPVTLKGKASGAILVRNPDFSVTLGHPATVRAGEEYDLFITVSNTGKSIANMVSVGLDPRALSGAAFVAGEANSKSIDTILPGSAATVKFRLKSQRTGKVTATAFESPDVRGRFILRSGVGENNIPLSPDSLILPYTGTLPSELVTAAVGLLGQAWSVATAPSGALPASVLPISKTTITSRAYDLSEAGLRVLIGDNLVKAVEDLTFDLFGSDVYNKGFDSLRRSSPMGLELNRAIAAIFKTDIDASGALSFQAALADKVSYRPGHLSVITSEAPLRTRLTDASGNRSGVLDADAAYRAIPYADSLAIGENGSSRSNLILVTRLDSPAYTLELAADAAATFDLGITLPDAAGVLTQYRFNGVTLYAGATARMNIFPGSGDLLLDIDDNNDGTVDRTITPSSSTAISDHPPHIVAATRLVPEFGPGGDKHGRNVAVLFSERVTRESAQLVANYGVDENQVKQATIQPGGRMAFLLLRDGIGPFFSRSLTIQGLSDQSGKVMNAPETLSIKIAITDPPSPPAAVVTGTVRTARGEPVPGATIRLYQLIWYDNPETFELEERYALFTEKQANRDGSYRLEYVLQNDNPAGPFQIEAVNPVSGEVGSLTTGVVYHGQQLALDIFMKARGSLSGLVKNESGNPVSGATVQVITLADNRGKTMTTDASGAFSFSGLMVGAFNLKGVSQATLSEGNNMGVLPEDGTAVSQDLTIRKVSENIRGTVVGKVLGADGVSPRGGVIVIVNGNNYQNWQRTGADGSFSFSGVYAGGVTVMARDDGTGEQSSSGGTIATSGQSIALNVIMKGTGSVEGTVSRVDNKSAQGLYVVARPPQPAQARVLRTDAAGAFRVDKLPTGTIAIEIIDPNDFNRTVASGSVTILSAGEVATIALFVPLKSLAVGIIEGTVYHRDGTPWANAPLKQIVDSWHYYSRQVGSDGKFSIPALALGSYRFSVVGGNEVINISTDLWYDTQVRTLELRPVGTGTVTGTTWDDAAMTIPTGADITFYSTKPDMVGWLGYDTANPTVVKSDPTSGRFSFANVLQGSFTVSSSSIFRPTPVTVGGKMETAGQTVNVNLPLKGSPANPGDPPPVNQPGSISGKVFMPDGSAAGKDVRVTVTFGGADVTVTTDEKGLFHFASLIPAGNQPIIAEDPATTLKWKGNVYVPSGLDVPITIKLLGRGTVTVKVLDGEGKVMIPNAAIYLKGTGYPNDSASGASDANGQAVFTNLSEGSYAVSASGTGNLGGLNGRNQVTITADKTSVTVEVRLASSATVTGRFLKADGITPITGGQITLKRNGQAIAYTSSSSDPADPGRFRLEYIPLGDFSVEGYDPVTERRGSGGGRLGSNGETVSADVVVTPRGTVKGMILNYGGSAPVGAAPITISFNGGSYSSVTAPDGSFLFTGIAAGRFSLDAIDPVNRLHGQASGSLSYENETVTAQVRIAPTGSISGRVLMPDGQTPLTTATVKLNGGNPVQVNGETGIFTYDNLAAGQSYSLSSFQPGTRRSGSTVATISRDLEVANGDIILGGVGTVAGAVFEPDGQTPLSGAKVELHFRSEVLTAYSADDGKFSFSDIPTGSFTIAASHTLRTTGASQSGYLFSEGQTISQNLVLGPVGSVHATVLMADGVTPSRGGGIRITTTSGNITNVYTGITDSSGQYTFSRIPTPCSVALYVEDASGLGIGRFYGVLEENGQVLDAGTVVLDDKPITVTAINPDNGAVNVPVTRAIRILFSEPADISTLNSNNIYLVQGTTRVAGTLQIDADNSGVTFTPTAPLKGFTLYTMVVKADVKDRAWRNLAQVRSVSFTTVDNVPPEVTGISPVDGSFQIAGDAVVRITFSEPLDAGSLAGITLTSGGTAVSTRTDLIQGGMVVALTPLEPLALNRSYGVSVSGVKDIVGNILSASIQSSFTTIDTIVPTVTSLTVAAGADLVKGSSVAVTAAVPDSDVARVDFYLDEQLTGSVTKAPYTLTIPMGKEGPAHLKAIAQDRAGNRGLPATLDLVIAADQPPQLAFTAPADGSQVNTGSSFGVTLQGTDDLNLKDITLSVTGAMTAVLTKSVSGKNATATFSLTAPTGIVDSGAITLTATARDSGGNTTASVQRTLMLHDSIAPTAISLASPGQNVKYKPGETAAAIFMSSDFVGISAITCSASGAVTDSKTFTINPAPGTVSQTYDFPVPANAAPYANITVTCSASDAAGNSNGSSSKSVTLTVADIVPPTITGASITDNAVNVPTNGSVTVNFSETLSAPTVTTSSVVMTGAGQQVSGSVTLSGDGKSITFKPAVNLSRGGAYTLTLAATISDDAGNRLAAPYTVTFTTDNTAPSLDNWKVTPATGSSNVPVGTAISVAFDEKIDPASVTSNLVSLTSISGEVPGALTVASDGLSITFKPYNQLGFARAYTFTLAAGVRDISGNATTQPLTATFTTQGPDSDLVGYWPMDGDWTDYSGNGNNGTAYNGAVFTSEHIAGTQAGIFNGTNSSVSMGASTSMVMTSQMTVSAWIYPTGTGSDATYGGIIVNKEGEYEIARFANGTIQYAIANSSPGWTWVNTNYVAPLNTWTHLAWTYSAVEGKINVYANGVLVSTTSGSGNIGDYTTGMNELRIGSRQGGGQFYKGLLDEVALYKRALQAEDVLELYNSVLSSDRTPPEAPTVDPVPDTTYYNQVVLRGTKDAGSSIRVNGKQIIPHDANTTWQALYQLSLGQNLLDVSSHDLAGNVSPAVNLVVNMLPPDAGHPTGTAPTLTLTSPGQTVKYRPGETGSATVTATNPGGIVKLYCNASGAVSEGSLVVPTEPPQPDVTRQFTFRVSVEADPYEPYRLTCIAETVNGTLGSFELNLQVADIIPATVTDASIANNSTGVNATMPISVTFSEAMQPTGINSTTVQLQRTDTGAVVTGTVSLAADGKSLTFTPSIALDGATTYRLTVAAEVTDVAGNPLGNDYILQFTTQAVVPLTITGRGSSSAPYVVTAGRYSNIAISSSYVVFDGPVAADTISLSANSTLSHYGATTSATYKL